MTEYDMARFMRDLSRSFEKKACEEISEDRTFWAHWNNSKICSEIATYIEELE